MTWVRIQESKIKESGSMLPARVVLEYNNTEGNYRTFLETFKSNGEAGFQYGRFFESEAEAVQNYQMRIARL